jgi:two-component system, LytTR family, response regulator
MKKLKAIIIEDEHKPREALKSKLEKKFSDVIEVAALCENAEQAFAAVLQYKPDLLFLDISMPGTSGLEMLQILRNANVQTKVIITTSHKEIEHFRKAMHLSAIDYLLKPIMQEELEAGVEKVMERMQKEQSSSDIEQLQNIFVKSMQYEFSCAVGKLFLKEEQIAYIKAEGNYSRVFMPGGKHEMITESMKQLEEKFAGSVIQRVDRSHYINRNFVQKVVTASNRCYFVADIKLEPIELNETGIRNLIR